MEVAPGVYCMTVGSREVFDGFAPTPNVYLVVGQKRAAFVDTAFGKDSEVRAYLEQWESVGRPQVAAIVLTHRHRDHIGGAKRLRDATGAPIVACAVEKAAIAEAGVEAGWPVEDGDTLDLGGATLEFIHTPGHTMGSLCVFHREQRVLFTGDTILGSSTTVVVPEQGDMAAYIESLRRLMGYDARLICPGHGPVVTDPKAKIRELIEHRLERERQILSLLGDGKSTIEELFQAIYPRLDARLHATARSQIRAHLIKLEREGRLRAENGRHSLR